LIEEIEPARMAGIKRWATLALAVGATLALLATVAGSAQATTHDYCNWDGSYNSSSAGVLCFQSGDNFLTNNHALLPFVPQTPTIFCGAHSGGAQYGGYVGGNPTCDHAYQGLTLLKADEYVDVSATTHGVISY
jgi:hypothetical protein